MPEPVILLFALIGCICVIATVALVEKRLWATHTLGARRLVTIGCMAVVLLEVIVLFLMGATGDHIDPRCMHAQTVCSKD
jgi:hypothetical protein